MRRICSGLALRLDLFDLFLTLFLCPIQAVMSAVPSKPVVRLLLIRHAESEINLQPHLIVGQSNSSELTPLGRLQAAALGDELKRSGVVFDQVHTSTAKRAIDTAKLSLTQAGL